MTSALSHPAAVLERLDAIENDLAALQNELEDAALNWFRVKRDREKLWAERFVAAEGTGPQRKAAADLAVTEAVFQDSDGVEISAWEAEGRFEALKAKARVLETRGAIGMAVLKAQSRGL